MESEEDHTWGKLRKEGLNRSRPAGHGKVGLPQECQATRPGQGQAAFGNRDSWRRDSWAVPATRQTWPEGCARGRPAVTQPKGRWPHGDELGPPGILLKELYVQTGMQSCYNRSDWPFGGGLLPTHLCISWNQKTATAQPVALRRTRGAQGLFPAPPSPQHRLSCQRATHFPLVLRHASSETSPGQ